MEIDRDFLLNVFEAEANEQLAQLEQALLHLEAYPSDAGCLRKIFRLVHTLKGTAGSLGFGLVSEYAHVFESVLDRLRAGALEPTSSLVSLLLSARDGLADLVQATRTDLNEMSPRAAASMDALASVLASAREAPALPVDSLEEQVGPSREDTGTLRVERARLDRLLDLVSEITVSRERVARMLTRLPGAEAARIHETVREADRLYQELQEEVTRARMVPIAPAFRQYARAVRDVAAQLGKRAQLRVEAADVEVDASILEHLRGPIMHMIRNALDHGVEPPEQRAAAGKPQVATLTLRAVHEAGSTVIEVHDDGAGFDPDRILHKAKAMGLLAPDARPSQDALLELVFMPGFSTAERVTEHSGRGVGMDAVKRMVEAMRGTLFVRSERGKGASVVMRLPLTLAIIEGFLARVGEETFVLPMEAVAECLDLELPDAADRTAREGIVQLRQHPLPWLRVRDLLQVPGAAPERENVVVVSDGCDRVGLVVDALDGSAQVVIKPLSRLFNQVEGVVGSAVLGDGRVGLILDVPSMLRLARVQKALRLG